MSTLFQEFKEYLQKIQRLDHVCELLTWDMETTVPKEGFAAHADCNAYFATESFKLSTSKEMKEYLDALQSEEEMSKLDDAWKFIIKKMAKDYDKNSRIPVDFFEAITRERSDSFEAWQEAKQKDDFSIFAPHLEKMIEMSKTLYGYTDPDKNVYDAMLDTYEEGMDAATIGRLFQELKEGILPLLKKILSKEEPDTSKFQRKYNVDAQRHVQKLLLDYIGFNWERGAIGEAEHPFTMSFNSKDVRVTNHYYEDHPISSMFSAIHEGGHAIFDQNVNPAFDNTVAASCDFMGIHESQSRFYENILGRNIHFWMPIYEKVQEILPELSDVTLEEFHREINHIKNSFIRTEADEVTYCFHVILRYEIEQALFRDNLPVSELPALWNQKMEEYLQIVPETDRVGVLQDMHWSDGSFGYFPSYLLGSIYDGMLLEAIEADLGSVDELLENNHIDQITKWLNEKIHIYGNTRLPKETIREVCGREVTVEPLIKYFTEKYTKLYDL
ncbi:MAG: carboxypeptidase M32 [Eubacteriales bacterium]|nr:carboxypeptidase M32 [Eubacteriales bacterium]